MTFPNYVCTSFWSKNQNIFLGGCPLWPPPKNVEKNQNNIFAPDPQFLSLSTRRTKMFAKKYFNFPKHLVCVSYQLVEAGINYCQSIKLD
jgi:hypothetical protein